jgi:outer membrane murein-binding lipoprotein Lpp
VHIPERHRKPPAQRILLTPRNPAEEIHMLSGLVRNLNATVQSLWDTVHDLRLQLGTARPAARVDDHADPRPPTWQMPPANADLVEQVETLRRQIDELNSDAEYLWFEAQWLRAQLAVSRGDAGPPGGSP